MKRKILDSSEASAGGADESLSGVKSFAMGFQNSKRLKLKKEYDNVCTKFTIMTYKYG